MNVVCLTSEAPSVDRRSSPTGYSTQPVLPVPMSLNHSVVSSAFCRVYLEPCTAVTWVFGSTVPTCHVCPLLLPPTMGNTWPAAEFIACHGFVAPAKSHPWSKGVASIDAPVLLSNFTPVVTALGARTSVTRMSVTL